MAKKKTPPKPSRTRPPKASVRRAAARRPVRRKRPAAPTALPTPPVAEAPAPKTPLPRGLIVAGVGASAGGLEAFSQLLRALQDVRNLAIVFVQHLSPQHESALVPLLSHQTALKVVQASEGLRVRGGTVYVIPPNTQMELRGGALHLSPRPSDRGRHTPVDAFFLSLAESAQDRAIGIVLSGTAADGAAGVRDIKAAGGMTFAQSPESAKYDGMPRSAIGTGMIDLVLDAPAIARKLSDIAAAGRLPTALAGSETELLPEQLRRVFDVLRPVSGVDFTHYKLPTIQRRLFRRMALHRNTDVDAYIQLLESSGNEATSLYQDLLIHVTRFFRDPDSFGGLTTHVFPAIMEARPADQPVRVWVSGCATGEEAYSVAIALVEFLQRDFPETRVQIFATDLSEAAVEFARAGVYRTAIEADVSPERLRLFFTRVDGGYRVAKMIRDLCVFARQDLTRDPPFSHLDLILCRNVLIYMDAVLQRKLLSGFHYALNPGGFLVLGQAESVGAQAALFGVVDKKLRIHRKKDGPAPARAMPFAIEHASAAAAQGRKPGADAGLGEKALQTEVSRTLLERYAPPGVVVDSDLQIVQFRGQTGAFLEPAPGNASLSVLKMVREGLLHGLRTALQAVRKSRMAVRRTGLQLKSSNGLRPVTLDVIPLNAAGRQHYLVLFQTPGSETPGVAASTESAGPPRRRRAKGALELLQRELAASREYLQSIIQELEAANHELQSANEEILSSNEELQSTNEELDTAKEELQSTNEELNTVNEELHGTNDELSRVNSDLMNLLASVQIAIVIVSADLRIRRFTPMAEKVLNLIPGDLARSIGHINPNIDCPNLDQLIAECIDNVTVLEREVRDRQGRWFSLRIRPYKDVDNRIDGAVLALFDADGPRRSEERTRAAQEITRSVIEAAPHPSALTDADLRVTYLNTAFAALLNGMHGEGRNQRLDEILPAEWNPAALRGLLSAQPGTTVTLSAPTSATDGVVLEARTVVSCEDPAARNVLITGRHGG